MEKIKKIVILFITITILFSQIQLLVFAEDDNIEETSEDEVSETELLENQKSELETAISESESQISVVEEEISATLAEVENLSIKISTKREEINNLETEEILLMAYIEETEESLNKYTEQYEAQKALLEDRLIAMYEMGDIKYLDVLLNSENLSDFLSRYYLVSEISESDYELITSVRENKEKMESLSQSLAEKKEELEDDKINKEKYEISLSNMEILKNNKIESLNEEELALYEQVEEYKTEIENIEAEIKQIALQNIGEIYIGGTMLWPTPGYTTITSQFGMRTHPITGIYKLHTGVDIGAPYGSIFIAAADGVVVKAGYNTAYGNMVMIDHGGGVMTLYAHGSEILVEVGQTVTAGTAVLKVGSTGYSTGPHAHFEIRINGEYVNPLDYVSPTNSSVSDDDNDEITVELDS